MQLFKYNTEKMELESWKQRVWCNCYYLVFTCRQLLDYAIRVNDVPDILYICTSSTCFMAPFAVSMEK